MVRKSILTEKLKLGTLLNVKAKSNRVTMLKKMILLASFFGMPFFALAQQYEIQGVVSDSVGQPIFNAVIIASDTVEESNILAYNSSNSKGKYKLEIKKETNLDSIWLIVKHISHETLRLKMPFKSLQKDFILFPRIERLDEVFVKYQKKVKISGDTITYNVNGIKAEKDYTIEDVINRIQE